MVAASKPELRDRGDLAVLEAPFDTRKVPPEWMRQYLVLFRQLYWKHQLDADVKLMRLSETLTEEEARKWEGRGNSSGGKHSRPAPGR